MAHCILFSTACPIIIRSCKIQLWYYAWCQEPGSLEGSLKKNKYLTPSTRIFPPSPLPPSASSLTFAFIRLGRNPSILWSPSPADSSAGHAVHPEEHGCVPRSQRLAVVATPRFPPAPAECHCRRWAASCQRGWSTWWAGAGWLFPSHTPSWCLHPDLLPPHLKVLELGVLSPTALGTPLPDSPLLPSTRTTLVPVPSCPLGSWMLVRCTMTTLGCVNTYCLIPTVGSLSLLSSYLSENTSLSTYLW